jgi:hypothetical protein
MTTDGQIWIGSSSSPHVRLGSITAGSGVTVTNGNGTISISATGSGGIVTTIAGDTGTATGSTITFNGARANAGSTVDFSASGSTVLLKTSDPNANTFIGISAGTVGNAGTYNTGIGTLALAVATSGSSNTALGGNSLPALVSGSNNLALGQQAGVNYTGAESSNILLNSAGTLGESNALHIGAGTGSSAGQQNKAFISGINGVTSSNALLTTINSSTDQLGVIASVIDGVLISSHTGIPSLLANGTAGFVLTAQSGAPPAWASAAGGGLTTVGNVTSGSVAFDGTAGTI